MSAPGVKVTYQFQHKTLFLSAELTIDFLRDGGRDLLKETEKYDRNELEIDLSGVTRIDSSGVAFLRYLTREVNQLHKIPVEIVNIPAELLPVMETFAEVDSGKSLIPEHPGLFERIGESAFRFYQDILRDYVYLMADLFYWTFIDLFSRKAHRKGELVNQGVLIGVNAVPIIGLISFMIGLVLALQSAAQLRQFGANVFIADLTVIAMTREMGPLLTAIMIAGRSGSAIASEIATMKVTEEIDALSTMALNPIRYIVVPKMHASILTLPFLTIIADVLGIMGGMTVAYFYLDIQFPVFYNRMVDVLFFKDLFTGFLKSLVFAGLIVQTASYFGFHVTGGAEGVGRSTTSAVVASIFLVILADSALGLIFY
jgi:phospholipid/cholesterol/gamma-HCH transport system permease protein